MAHRRMFAKSITNSSGFLMMPESSQNLYFHLGMNADDDGFCEHFTVMRMVGSKPDDLKILNAKGFVRVFDERVLVIRDWKENNFIRQDRYSPSKYLAIYKQELQLIGQPNDIPTVAPELGKDSIELCKDILFTHWLSKPSLIKHKTKTPDIDKAIKRVSKYHSEDEIISAIDNYDMVLASPEKYFFTYKWGLVDFLKRGLEKFLNEAQPLTNFLKDKKTSVKTTDWDKEEEKAKADNARMGL